MISDKALHEYLQQEAVVELVPMALNSIGNRGEHLDAWGLRFNQLSVENMYRELKHLVNQLMVADMTEEQRLLLLYNVAKIGQVLIGKLRLSYANQTGLLNAAQQAALDKVLSIYYMSIMVYYSVWQRLSSQIELEEQKTSLSLLRRFSKPVATPQDLIKRCLFSIMVLLKQSLLEKHIGYRNTPSDTRVIWHYLNACYTFAGTYHWQTYSFDLRALFNYEGRVDIDGIYQQCLLAELIVPSAYRRHDLLRLHQGLVEWTQYMNVTQEPEVKPYLFVNLDSDQPASLVHTNMAYNPFDPDLPCLFINILPLIEKVAHTAKLAADNNLSAKTEIFPNITKNFTAKFSHEKSSNELTPKEIAIRKRLAQLVLPNLYAQLEPPFDYEKVEETYHVITGFNHIHYMLAGKSSLANLIHSHLLPEPLRPNIDTAANFSKPTTVTLCGVHQKPQSLEWRQLEWQIVSPLVTGADSMSPDSATHTHRTTAPNTFNNNSSIHNSSSSNISAKAIAPNQFQVQSMVAMLSDSINKSPNAKKIWQLGQIQHLHHSDLSPLAAVEKAQTNPLANNSHQLAAVESPPDTAPKNVQIVVKMLAQGIVPCGVRILNPESRLPRFMPALIIPKNPEQVGDQTRLMMARFGYQVHDKLLIRIDSKEVKIRLTKLLDMTDDVEAYAFERL